MIWVILALSAVLFVIGLKKKNRTKKECKLESRRKPRVSGQKLKRRPYSFGQELDGHGECYVSGWGPVALKEFGGVAVDPTITFSFDPFYW